MYAVQLCLITVLFEGTYVKGEGHDISYLSAGSALTRKNASTRLADVSDNIMQGSVNGSVTAYCCG